MLGCFLEGTERRPSFSRKLHAPCHAWPKKCAFSKLTLPLLARCVLTNKRMASTLKPAGRDWIEGIRFHRQQHLRNAEWAVYLLNAWHWSFGQQFAMNPATRLSLLTSSFCSIVFLRCNAYHVVVRRGGARTRRTRELRTPANFSFFCLSSSSLTRTKTLFLSLLKRFRVNCEIGIFQPTLFYHFKQDLTSCFMTSWVSHARRNFKLGVCGGTAFDLTMFWGASAGQLWAFPASCLRVHPNSVCLRVAVLQYDK